MTSSLIARVETIPSGAGRQRRSGPVYWRGLPGRVWQDALNRRVPHTTRGL
jgi:hypothetical protein